MGDSSEPGTARIVKKPKLIPFAIKLVGEVTPVLWCAANAINQQDRNPLRVIRLGEIDSETVIAKKVERPPYSASTDVSGKAFVVERDHLSKCKVQFTAEFFVFFRDSYGRPAGNP